MDLTNELIERRFREVEAILDRLFGPVREAADAGRYCFLDRSYRGGFDPSGYPRFAWEAVVQQDEVLGDRIRRAEVRVTYDQPLTDTVPGIRIKWLAEMFNRGSLSYFERSAERVIGLGDLESRDVIALLAGELENARAVLGPSR
jgi:hypothetical protein